MIDSPPQPPCSLRPFDPSARRGPRARLRATLQRAAGASGVASLACALRRKEGVTILMYHSVADETLSPWIDPRNHIPAPDFARHMEYIARTRAVLAMGELARRLATGQPLPIAGVVLTFDDGYLDNLTIAAPILRRLGLPATLYLPTDMIDRVENQWVDRLYAMFRARTRDRIEIADEHFDLRDPSREREAYRLLCARLLVESPLPREDQLRLVHDHLRPFAAPPRLTMNWDEVREIASMGFEIGAHTAGHTDLRAHADRADHEVRASRDAITRHVGRPPIHFSFPYGRSCDASRRAVSGAGFATAVDDSPMTSITPAIDPLALPRAEGPRSLSMLRWLTCNLRAEPRRRPADLPAAAPAQATHPANAARGAGGTP